jgi:hypothetical protein
VVHNSRNLHRAEKAPIAQTGLRVIAGVEALFLGSVCKLLATRKALIECLPIAWSCGRTAKSSSALDV